MSTYYENDFYEDCGEFDVLIDEFKKSLMNKIKQEFLDEMESIKRKNIELQEVKDNWESIKSEYHQKEMLLASEKSNFKNELRSAKLSELLEDRKFVMYKADSKYTKRPKCNLCDDNRQLRYTTPLGKNAMEACTCAIQDVHYYPSEHVCYEFRLDNFDRKLKIFYKKMQYDDRGIEYFEGETRSVENIYNKSMEFDSLGYYNNIFFDNKDDCQKYCDWLNKVNNEQC